ncbi:MAG: response regulator [Candidatus Omnitrophota bacterium]
MSHKQRILIIDDEVQIRELLGQMLSREGYEVENASNGKEGMKICREKDIDLIITDIIMPEKDGIEMILELSREFSDLKIIAISGGGRLGPDGYLDMAKKLGAQRTFFKPFNRREILEAIQELLDVDKSEEID